MSFEGHALATERDRAYRRERELEVLKQENRDLVRSLQRLAILAEDQLKDELPGASAMALAVKMEDIVRQALIASPTHTKTTEELAEWLYDQFDPDAEHDACDAQFGPRPPWDRLTYDQHCRWVKRAIGVLARVATLEEGS